MSAGVAPVAGVEFPSALESFSAEEGRTAGVSVDEAGEECSTPLPGEDGFAVLRSGVLPMKDCSTSGDSLRVTIKELDVVLEPFERPLGVEPPAAMMSERRGA